MPKGAWMLLPKPLELIQNGYIGQIRPGPYNLRGLFSLARAAVPATL